MNNRLLALLLSLALLGCATAQSAADEPADGLAQLLGANSRDRVGVVESFSVPLDIDGDGTLEALRLAWRSGGGSGTFDYLVITRETAAAGTAYLYAAPLGDRVQLQSVMIQDATIIADTIQTGPGDAACCPGQKKRRSFELQDGALTETGMQDRGRVSLDDLAGTWRLVAQGRNMPAPPGIDITLEFKRTRIGGSSGCNRYMGLVAAGDIPGEIALAGPLGGTRMACPDPAGRVESEYLGKLGQLQRFSFLAGQLVISWRGDDGGGILVYERQ